MLTMRLDTERVQVVDMIGCIQAVRFGAHLHKICYQTLFCIGLGPGGFGLCPPGCWPLLSL